MTIFIIVFITAILLALITIYRFEKRCKKYTKRTFGFYKNILSFQTDLTFQEVINELLIPNSNDPLMYTFRKDEEATGGELTFYGESYNQMYMKGTFCIHLIEMNNTTKLKLEFKGDTIRKIGCGIYFSLMNEFMLKKLKALPIQE